MSDLDNEQKVTQSSAAATASATQLHSGQAALSAPGYSLNSDAEGSSGDDNTVSVPERLGPRQSGPLSIRGEGDENDFSPNDVRQGSIGDCYFLAALMSVAHKQPELLDRNITENSDGTYSVRLYKKVINEGIIWDSVEFHPIVYNIYPTFPTGVNGSDTASGSSSTKPPHAFDGDTNSEGEVELWVRLYEKAYALMRGSYQAIGNGGSRASALQTITGENYQNISTRGHGGLFSSNEDNVKERIIEMLDEGIPVTAGTGGLDMSSVSDEARTFARENSIAVPHAYAVMSADENSIRVRNPWGADARVAEPVMTWSMFTELFVTFTVRN